jgi:antitoxin VapB
MHKPRQVRLFRVGRNQVAQIPIEFELPGNEAIMHREGDRLVIDPVRKCGLIALLKTMKPFEETFPEIEDPRARPRRAALPIGPPHEVLRPFTPILAGYTLRSSRLACAASPTKAAWPVR